MAQIIVELSDEAAAVAEKHAKELGYPDAADWAFELLRNFAATREDALYTRQRHLGEQNALFGASKREQLDSALRAAAGTPAETKPAA